MNFLIIGLLVVVAILRWLRAWRLRKLSESELAIARSVTEMEKLMLEGEIKCGAVSHDEFFHIMQIVMVRQKYTIPWALHKPLTPEAKEFGRRMKEELREDDCPFRDIFMNFNHAYFRAFRYKHPFQFLAFPFYVIFSYLFLMGLIRAFRAAKRLHNTKEQLMREYVRGTALEVNDRPLTDFFGGVVPN